MAWGDKPGKKDPNESNQRPGSVGNRRNTKGNPGRGRAVRRAPKTMVHCDLCGTDYEFGKGHLCPKPGEQEDK